MTGRPPRAPAGPGGMPGAVAAMLARPGELPASDGSWAFEAKWDGVRALAFAAEGDLVLRSRTGADITAGYPELHGLAAALGGRSAILDGEIVAFGDDERPSFQRLQRRMHVRDERRVRELAREVPVAYVAFDLLWLDGRSWMDDPYDVRRAGLDELGLRAAHWQTPQATPDGEALRAATREQGLEGVVAKRRAARYEPGRRSPHWIKVAHVRHTDVVIVGWLPGKGRSAEHLGSLVLATEQDGHLRYAGRVGTGWSEAERQRLGALLVDRVSERGAVEDSRIPSAVRWVRPDLSAEVAFRERTGEGLLRAPSFRRLRDEAPATPGFLDCGTPVSGGQAVRVQGRTLRLTNLDKALYEDGPTTKRDVIAYLVDIAPVLLPHLAGRALTRRRYPDGAGRPGFFEKRAPVHTPPWVRTVTVSGSRRGSIAYVVADDLPTLVWLGNLAALELHTPLHRADSPQIADSVMFDLDPGPPATVVECCRVALLVQGMLEGVGLRCLAKTSGGKGLQVVLPVNDARASYDQTKALARTVAVLLQRAEPELVVSRMSRSLRAGRVFVDWSQNDPNKTTVSVYSLRAGQRPTVSTPVTWEEVRACAESGDPRRLVFTAPAVLRRVAEQGDLFAEARSLVQPLPDVRAGPPDVPPGPSDVPPGPSEVPPGPSDGSSGSLDR